MKDFLILGYTLLLLNFTFIGFAQNSPAGYMYMTSSCASGGDDYYFFKDGSVVIVQALNGKPAGQNATLGTWKSLVNNQYEITLVLEKKLVPAKGAKVVMAAAQTIYDQYTAVAIKPNKKEKVQFSIPLSNTSSNDGCEQVKKHPHTSAKSLVQRFLRLSYYNPIHRFTSQVKLEVNQLTKRDRKTLQEMYYDIYARYGLKIKDPKWAAYFKKRGNYGMNENVDAFLTEIETYNVKFLKKMLK